MVDFNNETTIGTPALDIVRVLILQARANVFEALEDYHKKESQGIDPGLYIVRARLTTWFLEHQAYLKRTLKPEDYEPLARELVANKINKQRIMETIYLLNEILDGLNLTKLDIKKRYDRTRVEEENKIEGI